MAKNHFGDGPCAKIFYLSNPLRVRSLARAKLLPITCHLQLSIGPVPVKDKVSTYGSLNFLVTICLHGQLRTCLGHRNTLKLVWDSSAHHAVCVVEWKPSGNGEHSRLDYATPSHDRAGSDNIPGKTYRRTDNGIESNVRLREPM